jgi:PhnB protein
MFLQPYLHFNGRCEDALNFYGKVLGAEVTFMMRYKDSPDPQSKAHIAPGTENKIMHSNVKIRDTEVMMSDGQGHDELANFDGFSLTLNVTPGEADKLFAGLSEGGKVQLPLCETFFADKFGMCADKFGVSWLLLAAKKQE